MLYPQNGDRIVTADCVVALRYVMYFRYCRSRYVCTFTHYCYFASAAVAVDSSHMTASSSASWSRFSPPSNFVNGHASTMVYGLSLATINKKVIAHDGQKQAMKKAYSQTDSQGGSTDIASHLIPTLKQRLLCFQL